MIHSRFDAQRMALDQVMGLSTECARDYQRLEQIRSQALAAAAEELARGRAELAAEYSAGKTRIFEEAGGVIVGHLTVFTEAKARADAEAADQLAKLEQKQHRTDQKMAREHADALWLVDTVLEGEMSRIQEANKALRQAVATDNEQLEQLQAMAEDLMARYRQSLPAGDSETAVPAATVRDAAALEPALEHRRNAVAGKLAEMRRLLSPRLFLGVMPWVFLVLALVAAALIGHVLSVPAPRGLERVMQTGPDWRRIGIAAGIALVPVGGLFWWLRGVALRRLREAARQFVDELSKARAANRADHKAVTHLLDEQLLAAKVKHENDTRAANARHERHVKAAAAQYKGLLAGITGSSQAAAAEVHGTRDAAVGKAEAERDRRLAELDRWRDERLAELKGKRDAAVAAADEAYRKGRDELVSRWERALEITRDLSDESDRPEFAAIGDWRAWRPPQKFAPTVRFGELAVDMRRFTGEARQTADGAALIGGSNGDGLRLPIPDPYAVPALLAFPDHANLLIKHG